VLEVAGQPPATLTTMSPPLSYPGDVPAASRLIGGTTRDLNIMTRRGRFAHRLSRLDIQGARMLQTGTALILWAAGEGTVSASGLSCRAGAMDAFVSLQHTEWRLVPSAQAIVWLVEIDAVA